jgi:nicotinate-nucleotide pyrophosphorylase (carboxylating)
MGDRDGSARAGAQDLRRLAADALREDGAMNDVTTSYLGIGGRSVSAELKAWDEGVLAGIDVARAVFEEADREVAFEALKKDGERIRTGDVIARVAGRAAGILAAERTALNFVQRLSGVATLTAAFVERVKGTDVIILDTRKTTPLLRGLEKNAVRAGGGGNHRMGLSDMVLVKDNHLEICGAGALRDLLSRCAPPTEVEVEVDSIESLRGLLGAPVDGVLLDNFSPGEVAAAVRVIAEYHRDHPAFSPRVEVSGGVKIDNVRAFALPGVHFISIGALTHSAPALNMSLEVTSLGG